MTRTATGKHYMSVNRRRVLQIIAAAGPTAAYLNSRPALALDKKASQGYGNDVDMNDPSVTWDKILTEGQLKTVTVIGDIIIPQDEKSPAASALDIADFVNEWVSAPYPKQQADYKVVMAGLKNFDQQAREKHNQRYFYNLSGSEQGAIFDELAKSVENERAGEAQKNFFERMVYVIVGGFYTTEEGMADIGYVGNVPLERFDGPPENVRKILGL